MFHPTELTRGPWDTNAQHGGAPAALLVHAAESAAGPGFFLARLTFELVRPVPIAPLAITAQTGQGRNARRVQLMIEHDKATVGRAVALMIREQTQDVPEAADTRLDPAPDDCIERFATPGMPDDGDSFHGTAMEIRVARGSTRTPGPAAAWFRLRVPCLEEATTTPAMRAAAAADFGNGISWVLPMDNYLFSNPDLTLYLHRAPVGEWIGLNSETIARPNGVGLASSTLYDRHGRIGVAHQNLLIRPR